MTSVEYSWKSWGIEQNIENKINNQAESGWRALHFQVVDTTVYVLFEKGTWPLKVT